MLTTEQIKKLEELGFQKIEDNPYWLKKYEANEQSRVYENGQFVHLNKPYGSTFSKKAKQDLHYLEELRKVGIK